MWELVFITSLIEFKHEGLIVVFFHREDLNSEGNSTNFPLFVMGFFWGKSRNGKTFDNGTIGEFLQLRHGV